MQFTHEEADLILSGAKTEHRFPVEYGERLGERCGFPAVFGRGGKLKWVVSGLYAIQTGKRKRLGKIELTGIRQQQLDDITMSEIEAEGIAPDPTLTGLVQEVDLHERFEERWNGRLNLQSGQKVRWNPAVWVLTFRLAVDDGW